SFVLLIDAVQRTVRSRMDRCKRAILRIRIESVRNRAAAAGLRNEVALRARDRQVAAEVDAGIEAVACLDDSGSVFPFRQRRVLEDRQIAQVAEGICHLTVGKGGHLTVEILVVAVEVVEADEAVRSNLSTDAR